MLASAASLVSRRMQKFDHGRKSSSSGVRCNFNRKGRASRCSSHAVQPTICAPSALGKAWVVADDGYPLPPGIL